MRISPYVFLLILLTSVDSFAQDIIITKEAKIIRSKVERMNECGIFYHGLSSSDSLSFISVDDVMSVKLERERAIEDTPDFFIINKIDNLYTTLLNSSSRQKKESIKKEIGSYYSRLDSNREDRIRGRLFSRIVRRVNEVQYDSLYWYINEYLLVTPIDKPGRDLIYEMLSQLYETSSDLEALEDLKTELIQYEKVRGLRYSNLRSKIILSIARVKKARKMGDELVGFWVSDRRDEESKVPSFFLYIQRYRGDTLDVHLYANEDIGLFDKREKPISAQRIMFDGINQVYQFLFSTDKLMEGNHAIAYSVVSFGSSLASLASERATIKSGDVNFRPTYTSGFIMNLTIYAAMKLAASKKNIEVMDFYGSRITNDILSSRFRHIKKESTMSEQGLKEDIVLEKDVEFTFYRVPSESHLCFFGKDCMLKGHDTEFWNSKRQEEWWEDFFKSMDFQNLKNNTKERLSGKSRNQVIRAYNNRSYTILNKIYNGKEIK